MVAPNPEPWWMALDRHRETEAIARHAMQDKNDRVHEAHDQRIDELESFRDELRGAMDVMRLLVGTNVLLAIATLVAIWTGLVK